ncbi:MAG: hypothetical protein IRY94_14130 [Rhodospirillaceae bacterium]|nr:hypothetical protein [Rhodospirillaceae bacterium]
MSKADIPATTNPDWGFWGSFRNCPDQAKAWATAIEAIGAATGCPAWAVRDFLDSPNGRHFADDVTNGLAEGLNLRGAVERAVTRWSGWRIGARLSKLTGIPRGLPYLTGLVCHFQVLGEEEAA